MRRNVSLKSVLSVDGVTVMIVGKIFFPILSPRKSAVVRAACRIVSFDKNYTSFEKRRKRLGFPKTFE